MIERAPIAGDRQAPAGLVSERHPHVDDGGITEGDRTAECEGLAVRDGVRREAGSAQRDRCVEVAERDRRGPAVDGRTGIEAELATPGRCDLAIDLDRRRRVARRIGVREPGRDDGHQRGVPHAHHAPAPSREPSS